MSLNKIGTYEHPKDNYSAHEVCCQVNSIKMHSELRLQRRGNSKVVQDTVTERENGCWVPNKLLGGYESTQSSSQAFQTLNRKWYAYYSQIHSPSKQKFLMYSLI